MSTMATDARMTYLAVRDMYEAGRLLEQHEAGSHHTAWLVLRPERGYIDSAIDYAIEMDLAMGATTAATAPVHNSASKQHRRENARKFMDFLVLAPHPDSNLPTIYWPAWEGREAEISRHAIWVVVKRLQERLEEEGYARQFGPVVDWPAKPLVLHSTAP